MSAPDSDPDAAAGHAPHPSVAWPAATTRQVVLLGHPVAHSRSPLLHNTAFRALGLDLAYLALDVEPDDLATVVAGLAASGCVGANVTVPHKQAAHELCDVLSEEADLVGAVNTLWWERSGGRARLHGTTTDATGLARAWRQDVGDLAGQRLLLVGTGGAARAAAVAAARAGATLVVAGRRPEAAREVAAVAAAAGGHGPTALDLADTDALADAVADARLVCNATTLGMHGERLPDPCHRLTGAQVAYDLVYGTTDPTPFVADARAAGAEAHDGSAMLVAQAEDAFEAWTGQRPPPGLLAATMGGAAA